MSLGNIYLRPRNFFIKLSQASILLPIYTGLVNYKKLTKQYRILFYFFVASAGIEVLSEVMKATVSNNMPCMHLLVPIELFMLSIIYYDHFRESKALRLTIVINALIFTAVWVADSFVINSIWDFKSFSRTYAAVSLLCYALIYFHFMFRRDTEHYSSRHPMYWVNTGVIIYFGSNLLYFMPTDLLLRHHHAANIGLYFHNALNIIANCLYAQAFRCFRKQKALS